MAGNNIKFEDGGSIATTNAVSAVLNTSELLEQILLHLPPGHLVAKAKLTCRGFKEAIETSFALQNGPLSFALNTTNLWNDYSWSANLAPKRLSIAYTYTKDRFPFVRCMPDTAHEHITFCMRCGKDFSLERYGTIEGFSRLRVSNVATQKIRFAIDYVLRPPFIHMLQYQRLDVEEITFGKLFDAVARSAEPGRTVERVMIRLMRA